ncbi:serine hydrolase domain-containing protein [Archangium lipolyticum]|uniref:serine hydrolase domain-containing protein n=1 Tax=Archangium lipolyticum TaxID=2970465 RepID=UPI002149C8F4|nr:serine hydrolase [Archangium lipolyticum]
MLATEAASLRERCQRILAAFSSRPEFSHMCSLSVSIDGHVLVEERLRGQGVADTFSVTKTVLATLLGAAVGDGLIEDLDAPVGGPLGLPSAHPAAVHTWRHLLTQTRGCATDGPWDIDAVMALPRGWVDQVLAAPQVHPPGTTFRYDSGGVHVLGAALSAVVGRPLSAYAGERLFSPLGIDEWVWPRDPDGRDYGFGHLRLRPEALRRLGELWLDSGTWRGRSLVPEAYVREMVRAHSAGGPPEGTAHGYLTWVDRGYFFAGGWAGQHVVVVPSVRAVVVTTGDPGFDPGPPPTDRMPPHWRPGLDLVRTHLLPLLLP